MEIETDGYGAATRRDQASVALAKQRPAGRQRARRGPHALLAIVTIAALCGSAPLAQAGYIFQTIDNPADPTFNQLFGINNAGTIVGAYGSSGPGHPNKGYVVKPPYGAGNFANENFPGSVQTQVVDINNHGVSVGYWYNTGDSTSNQMGFVDRAGHFSNINDPLTSGTPLINQLLGINDHNIAAGYYVSGGSEFGYTYNIAKGTFSPVTISGGSNVFAAGINNRGEVDGYYTNTLGDQVGFLKEGSRITSLQAPGFTTTQLLGINNSGLLVGIGIQASGATDGIAYDSLTGAWNSYSDPFGVGTTAFNGVNDLGQIVGFYTDAAGNTNGLLATQVPEPGSLLLLASGVVGLAVVRRRRNPAVVPVGWTESAGE